MVRPWCLLPILHFYSSSCFLHNASKKVVSLLFICRTKDNVFVFVFVFVFSQRLTRLSHLLFRRLISLSKCCLKANASGESFLLAG